VCWIQVRSYHLRLFSSFSCSVLVCSDPFIFSAHFPGEHFVLEKLNPVVCELCIPLPCVCVQCLSVLYLCLLSCGASRFFRSEPHVMQFHAKFVMVRQISRVGIMQAL
jgi:hypothetical protein